MAIADYIVVSSSSGGEEKQLLLAPVLLEDRGWARRALIENVDVQRTWER
jgi:hypothetical protein